MARISKVGRPFLAVRRTVAKLILTVFLFALFASRSPAQTPQGPTIRVTVNRVNVGVTVTDSSGHFVSGLRRQDFHIFDNGVEQSITDFLPIEEPAQLVLLIESGPAVLLLGKDHVRAADTLLASVSPTDRVVLPAIPRLRNYSSISHATKRPLG